jgi:hypothetical protein
MLDLTTATPAELESRAKEITCLTATEDDPIRLTNLAGELGMIRFEQQRYPSRNSSAEFITRDRTSPGRPEGTRKFQCNLPVEVARWLRVVAAEKDMTMTELVVDLLEKARAAQLGVE